MKHLKFLLILLLAVMAAQTMNAHDFVVNGIYYNKNGSNAIVTYRGTSYNQYSNEYTGTVNIPSSVTYNGTTYSVTTIGELAFSGCSGLTSVTIPNSVTTIGYGAFSYCFGLTSVTIGNSVTTIGSRAFNNTSLTSVTIPNSVTTIGNSAFSVCTGLTSVTIPNSVTTIGQDAFYNTAWYNNQPNGLVYAGMVAYKYKGTMPSGTSIVLKDGCTGIAGDAFSSCTDLTKVTIPNSVTTIGSYAFSDCTGLTSVTIPNSVTTIGRDAFSGCTGLTSVTIGNSVTTIGAWAFSGCSGLTSVTIPNSVTTIDIYAFSDCTGLTSVTIGNSVTKIGNDAFRGCTGLTSVTIGNSVTTIGNFAFSDCTGLTSVTWNAKSCNVSPFNGIGANIRKFTFGEEVEKIPAYLCDGMSSLTSVTIPNSVTTIGSYAFYNCSGLTSVTIPNSVTTIGDYPFYGCSGLTSVTIPNSVTTIGDYPFYGCSGLTSVTWNARSCSDFSYDYKSPFYSIRNNIQNFTFGEGVEKIPAYLCHKMSKLTSVTIPNLVTTIGDYAFYYCTGLTSVTIPNSVTTIGNSAFSVCTGLTSVTIPNSVTTIGQDAFYNTAWYNNQPNGLVYAGMVAYKYKGTMPSGTSIVLKDGCTGIAGDAFSSCTGLTKVTIPNSVTTIGSDAFSDCSALDSIICYAVEPPAISESTFSSYNSLLTIPDMSSYKYHTAPYWENFKNISYIGGSMNFVSGDTIMICRGIDSDFSVPIRMQNSSPITALQCDVSSSISIIDAVLSNSRNGGDHTLSYYNNKMLIASPTLKPFKGSDGTLFSINLHTNSTTTGKVGDITLNDILMSTTDGTGIYRQGCTVPVYMTYLIGDANGDGSVDAADYVVTCNTIALRPVTTFYEDAANVNQDSHLDVSDLVGITRIALGLDGTQMHAPHIKINRNSANPANVKLYFQDVEINDGKTTTLTIKLNSPMAYKAMQMDVTLPAGLSITDARLGDRAGTLQLQIGENEDGSTRLVASTMGDGAIATGDGLLLTLAIHTDSQWSGDAIITIDNIIAATPLAERHEIEGISINACGTPSGIGTIINDDGNTLVDVYNLNGQLVKTNVKRSEAAKGLPAGYYIIGEEKVYVK